MSKYNLSSGSFSLFSKQIIGLGNLWDISNPKWDGNVEPNDLKAGDVFYVPTLLDSRRVFVALGPVYTAYGTGSVGYGIKVLDGDFKRAIQLHGNHTVMVIKDE